MRRAYSGERQQNEEEKKAEEAGGNKKMSFLSGWGMKWGAEMGEIVS